MKAAKRLARGVALAAVVWSSAAVGSAQETELKTDTDKLSYAYGIDIGTVFKKQKMDIDHAAFMAGLEDGLKKRKPLLTEAEIQEVMTAYAKRMAGPTATPAPGAPPDEVIVKGGTRLLGEKIGSGIFRRGETLVSRGMAGTPQGTPLYPVKFEGMPNPLYFLKDEFGDWKVFTEGFDAPLPIN